MRSRPSLPAITLLTAVLLSCKGPVPVAGEDGAPASLGREEAARLAGDIRPTVEEIRGLRFRENVPVEVVDDRTAREHFRHRIDKFLPERELRALNDAYIRLGLLPPGTGLLETVFDILEEQAGGYYDPERETFFILGDMPRSIAPLLIAHELTHALDDQHYQIDGMAETAGGTGDQAAALGALVEGSGTLVMMTFMGREVLSGRLTLESLEEIQEHEAGRAEKMRTAPPVLVRMLLAPYLLGRSFLLRGDPTAGADPDDINRAIESPPVSTEQILHPEKYWDASRLDGPRPLQLPDLSRALGSGWSLQGEGDLGELLLALLTAAEPVDVMSPAAARSATWTNSAAAGWGADRWHLYARGSQRTVLLATLWDSEEDAVEFADAVDGDPERQVIRRGDAVAVVAGDAGARATRLAEAALDALI